MTNQNDPGNLRLVVGKQKREPSIVRQALILDYADQIAHCEAIMGDPNTTPDVRRREARVRAGFIEVHDALVQRERQQGTETGTRN